MAIIQNSGMTTIIVTDVVMENIRNKFIYWTLTPVTLMCAYYSYNRIKCNCQR